MSAGAKLARVAFASRLRGCYDYSVLANAPAQLTGRRVLAPLGAGNRAAVGVVVEQPAVSPAPPNKIKPLLAVYDDMPPLPPATLELIRFCASYYHAPIGLAVAAALPKFFRRKERYKPPTGYCLREPAPAPEAMPGGRAPPAVAKVLRQHGALPPAKIRELAGFSAAAVAAALKKLLAAGVAEKCFVWQAPAAAAPPAQPPPLTPGQQQALAGLRLNDGFAPHLLFGVTGGGKTEIYMRACERALEQGGQALALTPEIHLTPQLERAFVARFGGRRVCVLHSALPDGERAHRWLMAATGEADIVLGTRLAVFTPLPRLRLLVVDEEHDDSYKQEEGGLPFHARSLAVWRAKHENAPFIAGSATPSLESFENARSGKWKMLPLRQRAVGGERPPALEILAVGEDDNLYHGMSDAFLRRLRGCLQAGGQALVFINRRGYARGLICRACAKTRHCRRCSAAAVVHKRRNVLCCHLCGAVEKIPRLCEFCGGELVAFGVGSERAEEALGRLFPDVPQLRLDSDTMSGRDAFAAARADIAAGKWRLLVGTQIIAKGHDFPKLAFVGILNADAALAAPDFRAEERLFALLSQVIGRGTRNPGGCRAALQTRHPKHPFYAALAADDVEGCWRRLLEERRRALLPPYSHLALLRAQHRRARAVDEFMDKAVIAARRICRNDGKDGARVFESVPPPVEKLGDLRRRQALALSPNRRALHRFLREWARQMPTGADWRLDVDPSTA